MIKLVTNGMPDEAIYLVSGLFPKMEFVDHEVHGDGFYVYLSPKQLALVGLPTDIGMAGKPVISGWCLPDVNKVLKGQYIPLFEKSIHRIKYAAERKDLPVNILTKVPDIIRMLKANVGKEIAVDLETNCLDPMLKGSRILTIAISNKTEDFAFSWKHPDSKIPEGNRPQIIKELKNLLENSPGMYHNAKFESKWLWHKFKIWINITHDSMLYAYLRDEHGSTALSELVWEYYPEQAGYEGFTTGVTDYSQIPVDTLCHYNAMDTHFTHLLCRKLEISNNQVWNEVLRPVTPHLALMELAGWEIDWKTYKAVNDWYTKKKQDLHNELLRQPEVIALVEQLDKEKKELKFSYDQKKRLLFDITKIKSNRRFKTKTGNLSTDADSMEWYANNNPKVKWLQDLKMLAKVNGIIGNELKERAIMANKFIDNRIHTNYNTHLIKTGRLSSTDPNQQNLPRDADLEKVKLKSIKQIYISRHIDGVLLSADYSQIEMRIAAALAHDKPFMAAYKNGEDVHAQTAEFLFGSNWTDTDRSKGKTVNFSILNDISAYELATDLDETEDRAQEIIDLFFDVHPDLRIFMDKCHTTVLEHGYIETPLGRQRRFFKDLQNPDITTPQIKHICRQAANFPIQSLASDLTLRTMAMLGKILQDNNNKSVLIGNVHDSLILDCVPEELDSIIHGLKWVVANFQNLTGWDWLLEIPLEIDISIGENLSEQYNV